MNDIEEQQEQWFAMRDLKRINARMPAYKQLAEAGFTVFTPMTTKVVERGARKIRVEVPFVQDLLFVLSRRDALDPVVERIDTLQYRYVKGAPYRSPMVVAADDMHRFITAVSAVKTPEYYLPGEITPKMYGARVRMICDGPLNGLEGTLLKIKGSGKKRLMLRLPGLLCAAIEIQSGAYIELLD